MSMIERSIYGIKGFVCLVAVFLLTVAIANAADEVKVVKIASEGGVAVTKEETGRLRVVRPGDGISPYGTITNISDGRIVLVNDRAETVLIDLKNGVQKIKRVNKLNNFSSEYKIVNSMAIDVDGKSGGHNVGAFKGQKKSDRNEE